MSQSERAEQLEEETFGIEQSASVSSHSKVCEVALTCCMLNCDTCCPHRLDEKGGELRAPVREIVTVTIPTIL